MLPKRMEMFNYSLW